jgi:lysozyme
MLPPLPPQINLADVDKLLQRAGQRPPAEAVWLLGVRGYYLDSMGAPGRNDYGIYDDAMVIIAPGRQGLTFNANTDPSRYGKRKDGRGMARLNAGRWRYLPGWHKRGHPLGHRAFRQARPVTVTRFGGHQETGWFGINIHRGGWSSTSSEGCQTLPPKQFETFHRQLTWLLGHYDQEQFTYLLIENK